jgi:formylglycine-generating enzyme required for sulfatase activity
MRQFVSKLQSLIACSAASVLLFGCSTVDTAENPRIDMVDIVPGTFTMGHDGFNQYERPAHTVILTRPYSISRTEVTQALWNKIMGENRYPAPQLATGDSLPVQNISWINAIDFCNKMSLAMGLKAVYTIVNDTNVIWDREANGYRLPTEAEWEFACRAGSTTDFYTGNSARSPQDTALGIAGWYCMNSSNRPQKVGQKLPNNFGLYDMHGNVWEWCWDWFKYYTTDTLRDPQGPPVPVDEDVYRIQKGGSFLCEGYIHYGHITHRHLTGPRTSGFNFGFRLARNR